MSVMPSSLKLGPPVGRACPVMLFLQDMLEVSSLLFPSYLAASYSTSFLCYPLYPCSKSINH